MSDQQPNIEPMSAADAAQAIAALPDEVLAFEGDETTQEAAPEKTAAPEEVPDTNEPEADSEEEDDKEAGEGDDEETPETETGDEAEASEDAEDGDPVFEVAGDDGETKEVKLSELHEAWSNAETYKTKQAEIVSREKEVEAKLADLPKIVQEATKAKEDELAQKIHRWSDGLPKVEKPSLSMLDQNSEDYNPDEYHYQLAKFENQQRQVAEAAQELQTIYQQRQREADEQQAKQFVLLEEKRPDLKDDETAGKVFANLKETYGLSRDDLQGISDHRVWMALYDAVQGAQVKKELPKLREKVKAPSPKPIKAKARQTPESSEKRRVKRAENRFMQTGDPKDFQKFVETGDII